MTWVKLDDQFFANPKVLELSKDAKLLYLAGLTHCAAQLTDGHISPGAIRLITALVDVPRDCAAELLDAGLWLAADDGYEINDFLEYNMSATQVKAKRKANAERQARYRDRQSQRDDEDTHSVSNAVTNEHVTPSVTNPQSQSPSHSQKDPKPKNKSAPKPARARTRPRPRNPIWDALVEECGSPTNRSEESDLGKTVKAMRESEATPEAIHAFAQWWLDEMPAGTMLTHRCYREHWGKFVHGLRRASGQASTSGRPLSRQEREMQAFVDSLPPPAPDT